MGSIRRALHDLEKVLISKDFSLENVKALIEVDVEEELITALNHLLKGNTRLGIPNLTNIFFSGDPNKIFSSLFRYLVDYKMDLNKIELGKPQYEAFLKKNLVENLDRLVKLINLFTKIRKESGGYHIDRNIFINNLMEMHT